MTPQVNFEYERGLWASGEAGVVVVFGNAEFRA